MIKIKIKSKTIKKKKFSPERVEKHLIVNGIEDKFSFYSDDTSARFYNKEIIDILLSHTFLDVEKYFYKFSFSYSLSDYEGHLDVEIQCNKPIITLEFQIDLSVWTKPWTAVEFAEEFRKNLEKLKNKKYRLYTLDPEFLLTGFGFEYLIKDKKAFIKSELDVAMDTLSQLYYESIENLTSTLNKDSLLTYFNFPEEIKTPCRQYLVYFAQFLADTGIKADVEVTEEVSRTLFKVTPKDKTESLEKIKEAISIFLNAPNEKNFDLEVSKVNDIGVQQWSANIFHLKGQLAIAQSVIQAKDATILSLELSNYQLKQIVEKNDVKNKDSEEIVKGFVDVTNIEVKGLKLKLPEILRTIKRKFS